MTWARKYLSVFFSILSAPLASHAQVQWEGYKESMPNQLTIALLHTTTDYSLVTTSGLDRVQLNGGRVSYEWTRSYPWVLDAEATFSSGNPLGQKLFSIVAGGGYARHVPQVHHWYEKASPFALAQVGIARTSSNDLQYLYTSSRTGFTFVPSAGVDVPLPGRFSLRPIFVDWQFLPYGNEGSVYLSYGAGMSMTFGSIHIHKL